MTHLSTDCIALNSLSSWFQHQWRYLGNYPILKKVLVIKKVIFVSTSSSVKKIGEYVYKQGYRGLKVYSYSRKRSSIWTCNQNTSHLPCFSNFPLEQHQLLFYKFFHEYKMSIADAIFILINSDFVKLLTINLKGKKQCFNQTLVIFKWIIRISHKYIIYYMRVRSVKFFGGVNGQ